MRELDRKEKSILLYLETCLVDSSGRVDLRRMNEEEINKVKIWSEDKFVILNRLPSEMVFGDNRSPSHFKHYVVFSDEAWEIAHKERRDRSIRTYWKK